MKTIVTIALLVTWQYSHDLDNNRIVENGGKPIEMTSSKCLQYIKDRTLPGTKVEAFKRYKIGTFDPYVISKEVSCVIF